VKYRKGGPMTDETTEPVQTTEAQTADLDPRVSTPDDGFPSFDEADSVAVQAQLDTDADAYSADAAELEDEH
jgi:hypothetical protein